MDGEKWKTAQRRLRQAVRMQLRTPDGRSAGPVPTAQSLDLQPPDLLRTPIVSRPGAAGRLIVAAKTLLRRLLAPFVLEPQTRFNQEVVAALRAQREELFAFAQRLDAGAQSASGILEKIDYLDFEDRFRGSRQAIESRQAEYVEYFSGRGQILDIGCGRGEFLALLQKRGVPARGVDLDEDMVALCREHGLTADCADAVDFLERQPDGAFGGVFMSQVVEHLTTEYLVNLLDVIAGKTGSEAVLIIETINPESMPVLTRWFWLDPTHVRLVHPETLQYLMERAGFTVKTVQFRHPVADEECLPTLELATVPPEELTQYNEAVQRLNARLFGPLDYFVVGMGGA